MKPLSKELEQALSAILGRLRHLKANWDQAHASYFDPAAFLVALQNCIATSRTVTFILQSHKASIPDFESWYAPFQAKFAQDSLMRWAKLARNKIEKQGDLETLSQVRAELIAGYAYHPHTEWTPSSVLWSVEQIRHSIPKRLLDPHVIESGALAVERRWIDVELPDREVLDALAHVYGQLALMIISLHEHCGVPIPEANPRLGEHLLRNLLPDGRVPSMERPFEDRGIYVAIKYGATLGYRREFRAVDRTQGEKALKRYGKDQPFARLREAKTLLEVASIFFERARAIMLKDGYHISIYFPFKEGLFLGPIVVRPQDRIDKYLIIRDIAHFVKRTGADTLLHISEAWTAAIDDIPKGKFADAATNREEILALAAANSSGDQVHLSAVIVRKKEKKHKVKKLLPTQVETDGGLVSMAPVLEVWGKLDVLRLTDDDVAPWAKEHFTRDTSTI
jgi:hypothetical protein